MITLTWIILILSVLAVPLIFRGNKLHCANCWHQLDNEQQQETSCPYCLVELK